MKHIDGRPHRVPARRLRRGVSQGMSLAAAPGTVMKLVLRHDGVAVVTRVIGDKWRVYQTDKTVVAETAGHSASVYEPVIVQAEPAIYIVVLTEGADLPFRR